MFSDRFSWKIESLIELFVFVDFGDNIYDRIIVEDKTSCIKMSHSLS